MMRETARPQQALAAPDYVGEGLGRLNRLTAELTSIFNEAGFEPIEPAILQPADLLFDLYGEEIWDRAFIIEDNDGAGMWCLRPDFTAPVARAHLRRMTDDACGPAARYGYLGPAFRRARAGSSDPVQHLQAGVEAIAPAGQSQAEQLAAEAEVFHISRKALEWCGVQQMRVVTGDLSVIMTLLERLALPASWRKRLIRHFRRPDRFQATLRKFAGQTEPAAASRLAFLKAVGGMAPAEAADVVRELLTLSEVPHIGLRGVDETAERFLRLAGDARAHPLSKEIVMLIESVLAVRDRSDEAIARLKSLAQGAGVDLTAPLARLEARLEALGRLGVDAAALSFDAAFGRNIDYYDGFVFEMTATGPSGRLLKLGGGGRYDRLFSALGQGGVLGGVGAALRPEAIATALEVEKAGGAANGEAAR